MERNETPFGALAKAKGASKPQLALMRKVSSLGSLETVPSSPMRGQLRFGRPTTAGYVRKATLNLNREFLASRFTQFTGHRRLGDHVD